MYGRNHWTLCWYIAIALLVNASLPLTIAKETLPDTYTLALHKALLFFNAQKSGKLPNNNGIPWRGDSGLDDGNTTADVEGGLVGGYYDAGDNTKFHFPMSYAMTMLSWSLIEYNHKYKAIGEYDHLRELIKWVPDDHYCWQRPEDMDYPRPVQTIAAGPDLAGEMAAALAAASIVFRDNTAYSKKLIKGAQTVFSFARDFSRRTRYSRGNPYIEPIYNSTGYFDEYMWGAAWLYYATGNVSYISLATYPGVPRNSKAFSGNLDLSVLNWDNKLPAAMLLLTRLRIFLNPGYPYEDMLRTGNDSTEPWKATATTICGKCCLLGISLRGWKWRDSHNPDPNNITGAMVGGPDRFDQFRDVRTNYNYTEPTLAGNAGLVAALVSLTSSGGHGIDENIIFSEIPPFFPQSSPAPAPAPWKP
ncbi:hypothetical protein EZV62_027748 [Acer yangbiense]|uniref:Endoglucanase n=1 Tax=Acer yangbiense TaxID=1000413 RepID=A0A5C7GUI3_9ROSI|nr:hypothetical protein EZV62_027748 [Acer yangbiense]